MRTIQRDAVGSLLAEIDLAILPRYQNLRDEITTKSSPTDFVTIADQRSRSMAYAASSGHS